MPRANGMRQVRRPRVFVSTLCCTRTYCSLLPYKYIFCTFHPGFYQVVHVVVVRPSRLLVITINIPPKIHTDIHMCVCVCQIAAPAVSKRVRHIKVAIQTTQYISTPICQDVTVWSSGVHRTAARQDSSFCWHGPLVNRYKLTKICDCFLWQCIELRCDDFQHIYPSAWKLHNHQHQYTSLYQFTC